MSEFDEYELSEKDKEFLIELEKRHKSERVGFVSFICENYCKDCGEKYPGNCDCWMDYRDD